MSSLYVVYAILAAADAPAGQGEPIRGIGDAPVEYVIAAGLAAAISAVDPAEFDRAALNRLAPDLTWLGPRAAAHQRVNGALFRRVEALLPLAFGAVFRDRPSVAAMLARDDARYRERLAALRGRGEWVAAVGRDRAVAVAALDEHSAALREARAALAGGGPGRAYLLARQAETLRRRELLAQDTAAMRSLDCLGALADGQFDEPLPTAGTAEVLRRVSYLVAADREREWLAALADLDAAWAPRGYPVRVTGPWPAYRFSALGTNADGA